MQGIQKEYKDKIEELQVRIIFLHLTTKVVEYLGTYYIDMY